MWIFGYGSLVYKADFPYIKKVVGYVKGYERKFWQASIDHRGVPEKPGRVVTLVSSEDPEHRVYGVAYKIHRRDVDLVIKHLDLREVMGYEKVPAEFHPITHHPLNIFDDHSSVTIQIHENNNRNSTPAFSKDSSLPQITVDSIVEPEKSDTTSLKLGNLGSESDSADSGRGSVQDGKGEDSDSDSISITSEDDEDYDTNYENVRFGRPFQVVMYFGSDTNEHFIGPSSLSQMALQIFQCSGKSGRNRDYLFHLAESMREICSDALDSHLRELEEAVKNLEANETNEKLDTGATTVTL